MPKRIPNLSENILDQALTLFSQNGYQAVDMKQVAQASGTSVGNLYNYFPSKPALFLAVFRAWRLKLLESLRGLLAQDGPRRDKILNVLRRLYEDMATMQGLWHESLSGREDERLEILKAKTATHRQLWGLNEEELVVLRILEELITGAPCPGSILRWSSLFLTTTWQLATRYPDQADENWKFLENLVDRL